MDEFLSLPISARVAVGPASLDCKLCKENLQSAVVAPPSRGSVVVSRRPSQSGIITRPGTVGSFSAVRRRRGSLPMAYVEQEVSKECGEVVREISHASAATRDSVIRQLQALTYFRAKVTALSQPWRRFCSHHSWTLPMVAGEWRFDRCTSSGSS